MQTEDKNTIFSYYLYARRITKLTTKDLKWYSYNCSYI